MDITGAWLRPLDFHSSFHKLNIDLVWWKRRLLSCSRFLPLFASGFQFELLLRSISYVLVKSSLFLFYQVSKSGAKLFFYFLYSLILRTKNEKNIAENFLLLYLFFSLLSFWYIFSFFIFSWAHLMSSTA